MAPAMDYYIDIFQHCLNEAATTCNIHNATIVDYGGGHGILSMVAKELGWNKVIYIDIDPLAVEAAQTLAQHIGIGADYFLLGDIQTLQQWSQEKGTPDYLLGMDVIEHIYNPQDFLDIAHKTGINKLLFTTASNPDNPFVCRRLHKAMTGDESGTNECPNFFTLRQQFIIEHYPNMAPKEVDYWAKITRGLIFNDILSAIQTKSFVPIEDPYNTCDPRTGSWTERILSIDTYRNLFAQNGYSLTITNGWYNCNHILPKRVCAKILNRINCRSLAPFVILSAHL